MQNEGMKVFVRVRPPISREVEFSNAVSVQSNKVVHVRSDKVQAACSYDHVFDELTNQSSVFENIKPLLSDVLSGYNACLFAYGQTSAGKSYTIIGPEGGQDILQQPRESWGILPRAAEYLFGELADKAQEGLLTYHVKASFLQLYNENLYDLLQSGGPRIDAQDTKHWGDKDAGLKIREIPKPTNRSFASSSKKMGTVTSEVYVAGLSEFRVQTASDVMRILATGTYNRATRCTDFNATSSRSHAVLQLTFDIETYGENGQTCLFKSKLSLVDLAGSEKMQDSLILSEDKSGKHVKELTSINKSLSCLGNVISALASSSRTHVPYRDSKLTRLLQDSFGGNTRTALIACVAPTIYHAAETMNTLNFADRAKNVMLKVQANAVVTDKALLARAENEIQRLKLLLKHALQKNESGIQYGESEMADDMSRLMAENEKLKRENALFRERIVQLELAGARGAALPLIDPSVGANPGGGGGFGGYNDMQAALPPSGRRKKLGKKLPKRLKSVLQHRQQHTRSEPGIAGSGQSGGYAMNSPQSKQQLQQQQLQQQDIQNAQHQPANDKDDDEEEYGDETFSDYEDDFDKADDGDDPDGRPSKSRKTNSRGTTGSRGGGSRNGTRRDASRTIGSSRSAKAAGNVVASGMDSEIDVNTLRKRLNLAASESQHQKLDSKLQAAEQSLARNLKDDQASLSNIQKMKRALEAELAALQVQDSNQPTIATALPRQAPIAMLSAASPMRQPGQSSGANPRQLPDGMHPFPDVLDPRLISAANKQSMPMPGDAALTSSIDKSLAMLLKQNGGGHSNPRQQQQPPQSLVSGPRQAYGIPIPKISKANRLGQAQLPNPTAMDRNIAASFRSSVAAASAAIASPTVSLSPTKAPRHQDTTTAAALTEEELFRKIQNTFAGINQTYSSHLPSQDAPPIKDYKRQDIHQGGHTPHLSPQQVQHHESLLHRDHGAAHYNGSHGKQTQSTVIPPPAFTSSPQKHKESQSYSAHPMTSNATKPAIVSLSTASALSAHDDDDSPVREQHAQVEIANSKIDIGKAIQMFSFRFNSWENIKLLDYDTTKGLHKCQNLSDGSTQWLDLKKKPIRGMNHSSIASQYEDDDDS